MRWLLPGCQLAVSTWGDPNEARDNVILLATWFRRGLGISAALDLPVGALCYTQGRSACFCLRGGGVSYQGR